MDKKIKELVLLSKDAYEITSNINSNDIEKIYNKTPQEIYSKIETYIDRPEFVDLTQEVVDVWDDEDNAPCSFKANVYHKSDSNDIIIAYKGSAEERDFYEDIKMFLGQETNQLKYAKQLYDKVKAENPNANITLTGHSLGGMLGIQVKLEAIKEALGNNPVTKENFLAIKKQLPDVTVFETPSIFLLGDTKGEVWNKYKDILELFGYELRTTKYDNSTAIVYNPKKDQLKDIHELGITSYQNAYSELSQAYGMQIGVINNVEAYNPSKDKFDNLPIISTHCSQHSINNLSTYINDDSTAIKNDYQNELI